MIMIMMIMIGTPYAWASVRLVEPRGLIVVSDIDDTVKVPCGDLTMISPTIISAKEMSFKQYLEFHPCGKINKQ